MSEFHWICRQEFDIQNVHVDICENTNKILTFICIETKSKFSTVSNELFFPWDIRFMYSMKHSMYFVFCISKTILLNIHNILQKRKKHLERNENPKVFSSGKKPCFLFETTQNNKVCQQEDLHCNVTYVKCWNFQHLFLVFFFVVF